MGYKPNPLPPTGTDNQSPVSPTGTFRGTGEGSEEIMEYQKIEDDNTILHWEGPGFYAGQMNGNFCNREVVLKVGDSDRRQSAESTARGMGLGSIVHYDAPPVTES